MGLFSEGIYCRDATDIECEIVSERECEIGRLRGLLRDLTAAIEGHPEKHVSEIMKAAKAAGGDDVE